MDKKVKTGGALVLAVILIMLQPDLARAVSAVSITLSKTEGSNVSVTGGSGAVKIRKNMKLYSGYRIATEKKSYAYMLLDKEKAVKLDQNAAASIEKEGKKNEINLEYGKLFFNVSKKLASGETVQVKTSNNTMGIRGTSGTVQSVPQWNKKGRYTGTLYNVQIYDGKGYISYYDKASRSKERLTLNPGKQMIVAVDKNNIYVIEKKKISLKDIPSFALEEILKDADLLKRVINEMGTTKEALKLALEKNRAAEDSQEQLLEDKKDKAEEQLEEAKKIIYEEDVPEPGLGEERREIEEDSNQGGNSGSGGGAAGGVIQLKPVLTDDGSGLFNTSVLNDQLNNSSHVILQTLDGVANYIVSGNEDVTIPAGKMLTVPKGMTLENRSAVNNNGTLENNGNESLHNFDVLINTGTINNSGKIVNEKGGYIENRGTIKIQNGAAFYNSAAAYSGGNESAAVFINKENGTIIIEGTAVNGEIPKDAYGGSLTKSTMSNYGKIEGTLINQADGYLLNQGTIGHLSNKGILNNKGAISSGDTQSNGEDDYIISFIDKNGRQMDMPQKLGEEIKTPSISPFGFNGWDQDIKTLKTIQADTVVKEYSDAQKPECVLYDSNVTYGYGLNFTEAAQAPEFNSADYGSIILNKNVKLTKDITLEKEMSFQIDLNGCSLDLNGHSITLLKADNYHINGNYETKDEIILNYDESRGAYVPIQAEGSNMNLTNIKIQVSKGTAIKVASGRTLFLSNASFMLSGGTGIQLDGTCNIYNVAIKMTGGTGIDVQSGGTLATAQASENFFGVNVSGGTAVYKRSGGILELDYNYITKEEISPGKFLEEE